MDRSPSSPLWKSLIFSTLFLLSLTAGTHAQDLPEAAIIGRFAKGPIGVPLKVDAATFSTVYGSASVTDWPAELQASRFFIQGGPHLHVIRASPDGPLFSALVGSESRMTGLHALPLIRNFGILLCPELTLLPAIEIPPALAYWKSILGQRRASLILDPPPGWTTSAQAITWVTANIPSGTPRFNLYYPYLRANIGGTLRTFGGSGTLAAAWLKNDTTTGRGIWDSPSGNHLTLVADSLSQTLTNTDETNLNNNGIGIVKFFTGTGIVPWSARHLDGGNTSGNPDNRYISTQRTLDWISHHILRSGYIHATHRPNNTTLWTLLKAHTEAILGDVYARGGLVGATAAEAYFVQCGMGSTMTVDDINNGQVIVRIGIATLRPNEFLIQTYTWNTREAAFPPPPPILLMHPGASPLSRQLFHFATPGTTLTLKTSTGLDTWGNFANPLSGDGTWHHVPFTIANPKRFFRIEQTNLLPP